MPSTRTPKTNRAVRPARGRNIQRRGRVALMAGVLTLCVLSVHAIQVQQPTGAPQPESGAGSWMPIRRF